MRSNSSKTLHERAETQKSQLEQLNLAFGLNIEELHLIKNRQRNAPDPYEMLEQIPSEFWMHKQYVKLPANRSYRRNLCIGIVDGHHKKKCKRLEDNPKDFHLEAKENCICKECGRHLE